MLSRLASEDQRTQENSELSAPCALWPVDLKLTHVDCNPEDILVHFQGQYLTICELDYNILQVEIQNAPKTKTSVEIGEFCLVEDVLSGRWYRGRVQNKHNSLFDVFLLDHGNILTVNASHLASASEDLFMIPPKIVCGFFANVLPLQKHWHSLTVKYFSSLIGSEIKGYIQGLLPHKVLVLEAPDVNKDLLKLDLGKHVDRDTFLLLVEMLTEVPLKQSSESVPDLLIEKQIGQEFSFRPSSLHGFENILSFCSPKLSVGKKERARITAAVNPGAFYCQLRSMGKDLKEMSDKLSRACESESKVCSDKNIGNLGLLCSVKGKNEKWHRGFVQYLPVNSQVRVLFVDYGYCESVRVKNILQLPSEFLSVPIVAFPCALSCLSKQDEVVLKRQLNYLKRGLLGEELEIQIDFLNAQQNLYSVTLDGVDVEETESPVPETTKSGVLYEVEKHSSQSGLVLQCTDESKERISSNAEYFKEIKEDAIFEGFVEHVLNPTSFWLRTEERNRDFEDLLKDMTEYFSGLKLDEGILENPVPGALCCAMYEKDMHYYRARVTDTIEKGAEVYFIDFGNTEKVPYMLIKTLPQKFALEPEFALKCSLSHVVPIEDVWTVSATDYFRQIVSNKTLLVHVVHKRKREYVVELYEKGNTGESIALLMTNAKMAEYWKRTFTDPVQFDRVNKAGKFEQTAGRDFVPGNGSQSSSSEISGMHQRVSPVKCTELPAQHLAKPVSATTQLAKQNVYVNNAFKVLMFRTGNELAVRCSHVNSPSDFWCQLKSTFSKLDELMEKIQWHYETHADPWQQNESCCIVKCPNNAKWYRGCVLRGHAGELDVILVDTGMVVKEKVHNLQAIKAEYLELEGQAFRCSLYNIEPGNSSVNVWRTNASSVLKQFAKDNSQDLKCTIYTQLVVKNKGFTNAVDLHTPFKSATKFLLCTGMAREVQSPKQLVASVYPFSYTYSLFNMKIGSKEQVYVTHVCSPWEFYCQLDKIGELLEGLMEKAQKASSEMQSSSAAQGRLCLAKYYVDGQWYRGLAYPVQSSLHLNVFFVDYGNMQVVEKSNVLPISRHAKDLLFVPMLALKCSLSDVPKGEMLADVNFWLEKTVLNKLVQAEFVGKDEEGTILCDLLDGSLHVNKKVKEIIAIHGHTEKTSVDGKDKEMGKSAEALKIVGKTKEENAVKAKKMPKINESCSKTRRASGKTTPRKSSKSLKSTNSQQENESHENKTLRNEHTHLKYKDNIVVENHKDKVACGHFTQPTTSNLLPNLSHLPESKVKPGFRGIGFVAHVNTVTSFYIQMEDDEQAILKMGEDLNEAQVKETMENITGKLNVGDVIACEYEEDGALYRAVAINVSDAKIKVEFIDYGNETTVDNKNAHRLPVNFLTQPRLSTPCLLDKSHTFGCDASFKFAATGKPIQVEFVRQCGSQWEVRIEICEVSPSVTISESSKGEEYSNLLETENKLVPEDMTKGEKDAHNCCLDTLGVEIKEMANNSTVNSEAGTQMEMSQNFVRQETMKAISEVTSQRSTTIQDKGYVLTSTKLEKFSFLLKSSKLAACKKPRNKKSCQRTRKMQIGKRCHVDDEMKRSPKVNPELTVSHATAVEHTRETTEGQTKRVCIPHQNITAGQTEHTTLLSFLENGDLYVGLHRNSKLLALLDKLIAEQSLKASPVSKVDINEGLECLAKSNRNNQWYRASVQNSSEGECSVLLLDHGTTEVVSLDDIKELCTALQHIPKQAVLCKWNGSGCPIEGAYEMLKETLNLLVEQNFKLMFISYSEASQIWVVDIMINGIFLQQQLEATSCLKHGGKDGTYSATPCTAIKTMDKALVDGSSCAQRLSLAPVQLDFGHAGFAAAVTAPCEFYIVLEDTLLIMSTVSTILETLPEDLDSMPEAVVVPGAGCLVKCETKKKWCRAEIVQVDRISVVINLVDYGHCTRLPCTGRGQLKRLPKELSKLPKITYPCVLRGVKPAGVELWTDEAAVFFQERICQKSLLIYFKQYVSEGQWEVDIVSGGVHVAMELVDAGYASYIDNMLGLQQRRSPIGASQLKFIPRTVRSTLKSKPESQPAEAKDASALAQLEFENTHRREHADQGNCQATDDSKNQSDEGTNQDPARKREEEASANESSVESTMNQQVDKKLTKPMPGARKCIQM